MVSEEPWIWGLAPRSQRPNMAGGSGGQSYIGEPATSAARGLPVSGGPQPVKPYIAPPEPTPEEVAESGAWLITGKGNVYTLSSIGSPCTLESLREESEGGSGYLDSLDADHATPEEVAAVKAWLRRWLSE